MKNTWKKFISVCLSAIAFVGCSPVGSGTSSSSKESSSTSIEEEVKEEFTFEQVYQGSGINTLQPNESIEIPIGADIQGNNYIKLELNTNVNLVGYIHYEKNTDASRSNKEKIFIEQGSQSFTTFLDAFRVGAQGVFKKKLTKITLENVGESEGLVSLLSVGVSDRKMDRTETLYIDDGAVKIGTSLAYGGSLRYLEKLDASVVEYIDENGDVRIEQGIDKEMVDVVSDQVNLINIYDLGREIQQSYYSMVTEENGYAPEDEVLYPGELLYNPVQAGSAGDKESQIIDYKVTEDEIYIKVKPMDWFFKNTQADAYMENRYYFEAKGVVRVLNRFVNFSQFTGMKELTITGQETPATYIVHPLNYFYCETMLGTIKDSNLSPQMTAQNTKTNLFDGVEEDYFYFLDNRMVVNEWFAFVNDKNFGVGMYMPNAKFYSASRGCKSISYGIDWNSNPSKWWPGFSGNYVSSAYVSNYNYCCPVSHARMLDFVPFEYEYALYVGMVEDMRDVFGALKESGTMTNESVYAWDK